MLDLAQEILAIRHFIKRNPEIEQMADFIEMISSVERQDFESTEELEKEIGTSKEDGLTHTEDVIKKGVQKEDELTMKTIKNTIKTALAVVLGLAFIAYMLGSAVLQYSYSQRPLTAEEMAE